MELEEDELEMTREMHTGEITKKNILDCSKEELKIRCANDERIIRHAHQIIKKLEKDNKELKSKIESYKRSYEAERDIDEEFE